VPATKRGIYHNLKESTYTVSNGDAVLFFSSEFYRDKFLNEYKEHRKKITNKLKEPDFNFDLLADNILYKNIEKRGFRVLLFGCSINQQDFDRYSIKQMMVKKSNDWFKIKRPSIKERLKEMSECDEH
jgi:hypothetical protein